MQGDLGVADFNPRKIPQAVQTDKYKALTNSDSFDWACGLDQEGKSMFSSYIRKKCRINFKDGKLSVDGSIGIKPSQVLFWESPWLRITNQGGLYPVALNDLLIFYFDSEGQLTPALFAATGKRESFAFYMRFLKWMDSGK